MFCCVYSCCLLWYNWRVERDKNRLFETVKTVGVLVATGILLYQASSLALTPEARRTAGRRDNWHCVGVDGEECYMETLTDEKVSFQNGYYVTLAHYKTTAHESGKGYHDSNPDNARVLCACCHISEEVDMGNIRGARLLTNSGMYTTSDVKNGLRDQVYIDVEDALEMREQARDIKREELKDSIAHLDKEKLASIRSALSGGSRRRV